MQSLNRRRFLGAAVGTGAAAATAGHGSRPPARRAAGGARRQVPNNRIGIQLYTMRDDHGGRPASVRRVLNFLGATGYTEVEIAGYYGLHGRAAARPGSTTPGCGAVSGHDGLDIDPRATRGRPTTSRRSSTPTRWARSTRASPGSAGPYTSEYFSFLAERFNEAGALAKAAGLQFFYHNHDFEFANKQADGRRLRHAARGDRRGSSSSSSTCTGSSRAGRTRSRTSRATRRATSATTSRTAPGSRRGRTAGGLRGRRPRLDRLPRHLRRRASAARGRTSTTSSSTTSRALASRRPGGRVQDRAGGGDLPAQRALLAGPPPHRWA